jgi:hypothetical protein
VRAPPEAKAEPASGRRTACAPRRSSITSCSHPIADRVLRNTMLLNLGEPGGFDIAPWADRVQLIDANYGGWET